jgi:hypothetical protein
MRRDGTRHASVWREDAGCRIGANGWFSLRCSEGSCRRTSGAGVNYWGESIRRKKELAPWGKPTAGRVIAHNPKTSFLGFYQLILAFDVSRRNRPRVTHTKHEMSKKGAR